MNQTVMGLTEVRHKLSDIIKRAYTGKETVVIEKGGLPVVVLLGIGEYEKYLLLKKANELPTYKASVQEKKSIKAGMDEVEAGEFTTLKKLTDELGD